MRRLRLALFLSSITLSLLLLAPSSHAHAHRSRSENVLQSNVAHGTTVTASVGKYTFVLGQASAGFELEDHSGFGYTVAQLSSKCDATDGCVGFSTAGVLKYFIQPRSQWTKLTGEEAKTDGFYYKPQWLSFAPDRCACGSKVNFNLVCTDVGLGHENTGQAVPETECENVPKPAKLQKCPESSCIPYQWESDQWTTCSNACGSGSQARNVTCISADEQVDPTGEFCSHLEKPPVNQPCNTHECRWQLGVFETCSKQCGTGIHSASLTCVDPKTRATVALTLCKTTPPETERLCNTHACQWRSTAQSCSQPCGGGQQPVIITCEDPETKKTVASSWCTTPAPASSLPCNTHACKWTSTSFTDCSQKCGSGTQTAVVTCIDPQTQVEVGKTLCKDTQPPVSSQACNTHACLWKESAWSTCSKQCGKGEQSRRVECVDPLSTSPVDAPLCKLEKPVTSLPCNSHACEWNVGSWSPCSKSCGSGVQTTNIACRDPVSLSIVTPSNCPVPVPLTQQSCNTHVCVDWKWESSTWGQCDHHCAGGQQTRTVICKGSNGEIDKTELKCANSGPKPLAIQACNTHSCEWESTAWTSCSQECGGGSRSRSSRCQDPKSGTYVNNARCATASPVSTEACNIHSCEWITAPGQCSQLCGGGSAAQVATCIDPVSKAPVPPTQCRTAAPSAVLPCNTHSCSWVTGKWSECSQKCGSGTTTAVNSCVDPVSKKTVTITQCRDAAPITSKPCNTHQCEWSSKKGSCSNLCGGGVSVVAVSCLDPTTKSAVHASLCPVLTKPAEQEPCNTHTCKWEAGQYGSCSQLCGGGAQTTAIKCTDPISKANVHTSLCSANDAPPTSKPCNQHNCEWAVEYSSCSAKCGGGTQEAIKTCIDPKTKKESEKAQCANLPVPAPLKACNTLSCALLAEMQKHLGNTSAPVTPPHCENSFEGGSWALVRRVAPKTGGWHQANDQASGTNKPYGKYEGQGADSPNSFSLQFSAFTYSEVLFATGDFKHWVIVSRRELSKTTSSNTDTIVISKSDLRATPYQAIWYNRPANTEDPWISNDNHNIPESPLHSMLYGESGNSHWQLWKDTHNGANMFVRSGLLCPPVDPKLNSVGSFPVVPSSFPAPASSATSRPVVPSFVPSSAPSSAPASRPILSSSIAGARFQQRFSTYGKRTAVNKDHTTKSLPPKGYKPVTIIDEAELTRARQLQVEKELAATEQKRGRKLTPNERLLQMAEDALAAQQVEAVLQAKRKAQAEQAMKAQQAARQQQMQQQAARFMRPYQPFTPAAMPVAPEHVAAGDEHVAALVDSAMAKVLDKQTAKLIAEALEI